MFTNAQCGKRITDGPLEFHSQKTIIMLTLEREVFP